MDEKILYLLAAALIAVVVAVPATYLTSIYLVPHPVEVYNPTSISPGVFVAGFKTEITPVSSFGYAYRMALENGSIVTVGSTRANSSAQSASIASSVTPTTVAILLTVQLQGNATGHYVSVWTLADLTTKYVVYSPIASKNVTQQVILPYSYTNDGKVYWQLSSANLNGAVVVKLWGYFETQTATIH